MRNVVCWNPSEVRQVINPFAEHIPDSLFRAVHSDWGLKVSPPIGKSFQDIGTTAYSDMYLPDFLEDFLREDRPHALAAILGASGSGKSHLVHWMRLSLKSDDHRMVLVVRKSGTSLRAIVEMIINHLPGDEQQGFLDTLNRAGEGTATRDGQKQQLLNDLAHAIREESLPEGTSELECELVKQLPHLFQDPHMREAHFLQDETIIAAIVDHIFAPSNAGNRPDKRRLFVEQDLPVGGNDFKCASVNARNAIKVIDLDPSEMLPLAIRIINRNLDKATARTLSFSGDRIEELMGRLRTHLKRQGKELILLIEEFARLQGIDRALLQAITHHGDDNFCKMRTAIAVTTGFFESVAETAYMRTTHIVDMDRSAGREQGLEVTHDTLSSFTVRYLNAVRLGRAEIENWSENAKLGERPPSKCAICAHRVDCHDVFGAVDGYGLFPFTPTALWNTAIRADKSLPGSLNPRVLQNNLLAEVLDIYEPSIRAGEFPPYRLLEKLGGPKALNLVARSRLQNLDSNTAERLIAFLELYDGSGSLINLSDPLREALNVPEIFGADDPLPPSGMPILPIAPVSTANPHEIAIENWINGSGLDQNVANILRPLVFVAIADAIDWDMLGLERSSFVGKTGKAFQTNSISFDRQTTTVPQHVQVKLKIPGEYIDSDITGAALQGLLRASRQQFRWDFEGGDRMLSAFLDCLEIWSRSVEAQLRTLSSPGSFWNPSIAALQLLCVAAAIGGKIKPKSTIEDMVDAAFYPMVVDPPCVTVGIRTLYDQLFRSRDKLVDRARAQISSMKGGRVGAMLDPHKFMSGIDVLRLKWQLPMIAPDNERGDFLDLSNLYRQIQRDLENATIAELDARKMWLKEMEEAFGVDAKRTTIIKALSDFCEQAKDAGLAAGGNLNRLLGAIEDFRSVQFDAAVNAARALAGQENALTVLPHLGVARQGAVVAGNNLRVTTVAFLDNVEQNLTSYTNDVGAKYDAVENSIAKIDAALESIQTSLESISSGAKEARNAS